MLMNRTLQRTLAALVATTLFAAHAAAAVLVNDSWQDSNRTQPASPIHAENNGLVPTDLDADGELESAWFTSNAAGLTVAPNHLNQTTAVGSTSWQTYFTPEATPVTLANVNDSLEVRWVFTPTGVVSDGVGNGGQNFRLAVVDSPAANRIGDGGPGAPTNPANYFGYAMFMNFDQTLRRTTPFQLMERNNTFGGFLSASGDWTGVGNNGTTNDPGYVSATQYTYTMTLTRNAASGLDIVSRMAGTGLGPAGVGFLQVSFTDPTPSSFTYDMFGIRPTSAATSAASFDTSLFRVTFTGVPEPASLTLASLAGLATLALRRRR
jgi:hypothetical protein